MFYTHLRLREIDLPLVLTLSLALVEGECWQGYPQHVFGFRAMGMELGWVHWALLGLALINITA